MLSKKKSNHELYFIIDNMPSRMIGRSIMLERYKGTHSIQFSLKNNISEMLYIYIKLDETNTVENYLKIVNIFFCPHNTGQERCKQYLFSVMFPRPINS